MDDRMSSGMNRLGAPLRWWGLSGDGDRDSVAQQSVRLQNFVAEVQQAFLDATARHVDAIFASNDDLARSAYDLLNGGKQSELPAAQTRIVSIILEAAAQHARTWAEFQHRVQEIYSVTTRAPAATAADAVPGSIPPDAKDKPPSGQQTSEKLVDAA